MIDTEKRRPRTTLATALGLNALLSLTTGAALLVAPERVATWIGADIKIWLRALGLSLIVHSGALALARRQQTLRRWARLNLTVIGPYPLALLALLFTGTVDTTPGRVVLLADAVAVGTIAVLHVRGLQRIVAAPGHA